MSLVLLGDEERFIIYPVSNMNGAFEAVVPEGKYTATVEGFPTGTVVTSFRRGDMDLVKTALKISGPIVGELQIVLESK